MMDHELLTLREEGEAPLVRRVRPPSALEEVTSGFEATVVEDRLSEGSDGPPHRLLLSIEGFLNFLGRPPNLQDRRRCSLIVQKVPVVDEEAGAIPR